MAKTNQRRSNRGVFIRAAVALGRDGNWRVLGQCNSPDSATEEMVLTDLDAATTKIHWITAEIPTEQKPIAAHIDSSIER